MRLLRTYWPFFLVPALATVAISGCSDEIDTNPTTSTSGSGGSGGSGGTGGTTSTSTGTAGVGGEGGAGGSGGDGGTGGQVILNTGDDDCPGDSYTLSPPTKLFLAGDTSTATHLHTGAWCMGGATDSDGPERVYQFVMPQAGSLKVLLEASPGSSLDPSLHIRENCPDQQECYGCFSTLADKEGTSGDITEPTTWSFFVDGRNGTSGEYLLTVEFDVVTCGDGVTNIGTEACDDGNTTNGDGCDQNCDVEVTTLFDTCDGEPAVLQMNQPDTFFGNTVGYADDYTAAATGGCTLGPMTGGRDRVYELIPFESGTITAKIGYEPDGVTDICLTNTMLDPGCWVYVLWAVGPSVCAGGTQIACQVNVFNASTISFPVQATQSYFVIVDGFGPYPGYYGPYNLRVELTP